MRSSSRKRAVVESPEKPASRKSSRRDSVGTTPKLKLVLSSSNSSASLQKTDEGENGDDDELVLSGEDEYVPAIRSKTDKELALESSPPRKLQIKLPIKVAAAQKAKESDDDDLDIEDDDDDDAGIENDDVEGDGEEEYDDDYDSEDDVKVVDSSKMTSRQRAKLAQEAAYYDEPDPITFTSIPKKQPQYSEEELIKRAEKTRRRQLQRDQKLEESKQATIQKLLQKQGARSKKMQSEQQTASNLVQRDARESREEERNFVGARYIDSKDSTVLVVTDEKMFQQVFGDRPVVQAEQKCSATGCTNPRKYTNSKDHKPVCSLSCYNQLIR